MWEFGWTGLYVVPTQGVSNYRAMNHIWLDLVKLFGFGKEWVNRPVLRWRPAIEALCLCQAKPIEAMPWPPDIEESVPVRRVLVPWVKTWVFPRRNRHDLYLSLWAGACDRCDRVYFGLATKRVVRIVPVVPPGPAKDRTECD